MIADTQVFRILYTILTSLTYKNHVQTYNNIVLY